MASRLGWSEKKARLAQGEPLYMRVRHLQQVGDDWLRVGLLLMFAFQTPAPPVPPHGYHNKVAQLISSAAGH
eukprot:4410711-Amphidinium_carterae.1